MSEGASEGFQMGHGKVGYFLLTISMLDCPGSNKRLVSAVPLSRLSIMIFTHPHRARISCQAYVHVVGIGLGCWKVHEVQEEDQVCLCENES